MQMLCNFFNKLENTNHILNAFNVYMSIKKQNAMLTVRRVYSPRFCLVTTKI